MKRFTYQGLGSILAGLLLCGCASTGQLDLSKAPAGDVMRFSALESAAPPVGAMQFCASDPERCGPQATAYFKGDQATSMIAVGGIDDTSAQSDGRSESFRYMLSARRKNEARQRKAEAEGIIFVSAAKAVHVTMTEEMWVQLKDVQNGVNEALRPATDQQIYGKEEVWALPLESWTLKGPPKGDCEDYALEKRLRLLDLGWTPEALSIVIVDAPKIGAHAVLVVSTDRGEFVLDNLQYEPVLAEALPYKWLSRQSGLDLLAWTQTRLTKEVVPALTADATPMPEVVFAGLLQERMKRARAEQVADALMAASIAVLPAARDNLNKSSEFVVELADFDMEGRLDGALGELDIIATASDGAIETESDFVQEPFPVLAAESPTSETAMDHAHPLAQAFLRRPLLSV